MMETKHKKLLDLELTRKRELLEIVVLFSKIFFYVADLPTGLLGKLQSSFMLPQKFPIAQAKFHYKLDRADANKLEGLYSSFRIVLGDGECFYRIFIFSYLEQVLERNGTFEEDRILCEMEQVGSAYESLEWKCNFSKYYESFKTLVNKVKRWKTETRAVRRENLLNFFGDYKESEDIFSFLRICAAAWVCTHDEIAAFHPTADGLTIEQFCRKEIIARRSFADHLAIAGLTAALGIQLRIFSVRSRMNQSMCLPTLCEASSPMVNLLYTGAHYDILYSRC